MGEVSWSERLRSLARVDLCSGALTFSRAMRWRELKPSDWSERYKLEQHSCTQYNLCVICVG